MESDIVAWKRAGYSDTMVAQKLRQKYKHSPIRYTTAMVRQILQKYNDADMSLIANKDASYRELAINKYMSDMEETYQALRQRFIMEITDPDSKASDIAVLANAMAKRIGEIVTMLQTLSPAEPSSITNNNTVILINTLKEKIPPATWMAIDAEMTKKQGPDWDKPFQSDPTEESQ